MNAIHSKNTWEKVPMTTTVKETLSSLQTMISCAINKCNPNSAKRPLVFTMGDPSVYAGFETNSQCLDNISHSIGESTGYTDPAGVESTREYLADLYSTDRWQLTSDDIFLTAGCSGALNALCMALADTGDTALLPNPGFPLMEAMCSERGVKTEFYKLLAAKDWEVDLDDLEEKLQKRPKFILVTNPSNPLGSIWSEEHIKDILRLANKYRVPVVADEVYELMVLPGESVNSFGKLSEGQPVFVCSGFSKMGLAPGFRLGWVVSYGRQAIIKPVKEALLKTAVLSAHLSSSVQAQLPEIFPEARAHIHKKMYKAEERVKALEKAVEGCPAISLKTARGAMYAVLVLELDKFRDIETSKEFAAKFLEEENVSTFPGIIYGTDNFIRLISLAEGEYFEEMGSRLKAFVSRHLN